MTVNLFHPRRRLLFRLLPAITGLFALGVAEPLQADLVKLSNGGELRGRIIRNPSTGKSPSESIQLETLSGATVVVLKSETQFVTMRSLAIEEYESRARRVADTLEAHWELSEWCRQRALSRQREVHLLKVVEHDDHHEKAQAALGRVWHEGAWVDRDELMASQGYVRYKGRYVTTQELDVIQKTTAELEQEREWFQKVKLWHGWLIGRHEERRQQGYVALQAIVDPHSAPALIRFLCEDTRRDVRMLGATILSKLPGAKAVAGLVKMTLFDVDAEIRYASLNGITPENFEYAQPAFIKELRSEYNTILSRAAAALGRVGDERAIAPLIDALITTHRYNVPTNELPGQTYSYRTDGSFGQGTVLPPDVEAAMRTGQLPQGAIVLDDTKTRNLPKKMVLVKVDHWNQDVLSTLQKITKRDFGYDERTWHLWWAAEKTAGGTGKPAKKK
ncbi:MAG: hypothetical protein AABP62_31610, partial [Planctomycetota bacterium]